MTSSFHRESGKAEGGNEKERSRDTALCETKVYICVCMWLECQWAAVLHKPTTNVPIHYCSNLFHFLWECYLLRAGMPQRCGRQTAVQLINHSWYTMRSVILDDINMTGAHVEVTTLSCNPLRDLSVAPSWSWVYIWPLHTNTSGLLNLHIAYLCHMQLRRCVGVIDGLHCEHEDFMKYFINNIYIHMNWKTISLKGRVCWFTLRWKVKCMKFAVAEI